MDLFIHTIEVSSLFCLSKGEAGVQGIQGVVGPRVCINFLFVYIEYTYKSGDHYHVLYLQTFIIKLFRLDGFFPVV